MIGISILLVAAVVVLAGLYYKLLKEHRMSEQRTAGMNARYQGLLREKDTFVERLRELEAGKEWYREVLNNTNDMVFVLDITEDGLPGMFLEVNATACEKLRYSHEELLRLQPTDLEKSDEPTAGPGLTRVERVTMSDRDYSVRKNKFVIREAQQLTRQILEEGYAQYSRVYVTRRGEEIPVEITARRFDVKGAPLIILTALDVTARQRTEQALNETERLFREFFVNSPLGVALYDANKQLLDVNTACLKMLGIPDMEQFIRFNPFDNPYVPSRIRPMLNSGETVEFEARVDFEEAGKNGYFVTTRRGISFFEILMRNLGRDRNYRPRGYMMQIQDITERRKAEEALRHSERQLRQAQKMEAIGTLAGGIAHDFNNILTPILGFAEMGMMLPADSDKFHSFLKEIHQASRRAKDLVDQILTFSRQTDSGGHPIKIVPIIKEVLKQQRTTWGEKISIKRMLKTNQDVVLAEPTQIHQVVLNLCTNACYVMKDTGGTLEVIVSECIIGRRARTEFPHLEPGPYIRITVKDTGCGMEKETAERIFEPFFTTKPSGEGTGMGLAVVHGIVTNLGGAIRLETEPGKGTTFHVVLPRVEEEVQETVVDESPIPRGTESIAFVDDEEEITRMIEEMLSSLGYRATVYQSSTELLAAFLDDPGRFDLVMTDQVMPGMTGDQLVRKLLTMRPDLPMILCTGFSETITPARAKELGVREFLLKPVSIRELAGAIRQALDAKPHVSPVAPEDAAANPAEANA